MFKTFANNELLTAADLNNYLMRQAVIVVANKTERDNLPLANAGMLVYRVDADRLEIKTPNYAADNGWRPVFSAGLVPIVPSAISGTGFVKASSGKMTLTGNTLARFTFIGAEFTNYKVMWRVTAAASAGDPLMRLLNGSTPAATNYSWKKEQTTGGTPTITTTPTTSFNVGRVEATNGGWGNFDLYGPGKAWKTGMEGRSGDAAFQSNFQGTQTDNTVFDGVELSFPANVTAEIWAYGYNNG